MRRALISLVTAVAVLALAGPAQATNIDPWSGSEFQGHYGDPSTSSTDIQACYTFSYYLNGSIGSVNGTSITPGPTDGSPNMGAWVRYIVNSRNTGRPTRTIFVRDVTAYRVSAGGMNHVVDCGVSYRALNYYGISDFYTTGYRVTYWMNASPAPVPVQWTHNGSNYCWATNPGDPPFPC